MWRFSHLPLRAKRRQDVQPGASKRISPPCSPGIIESVVGRFFYSPLAGHLSSSFGAWWRVRESPHHAPNNDERVQTGESKRISPPCSLVIQSMVGRFSYSPQAGLSHHHWVHGQEILLLATMRQTTTRYVLPKACKKSPHHTLNDDNRAWWEILLLAPGWTSFIVVRRIVGHLPTMCRTTMRNVQPEASKRISPPCSLVVIWSMVGKFSYSSQAGHLIVVWRVVASK